MLVFSPTGLTSAPEPTLPTPGDESKRHLLTSGARRPQAPADLEASAFGCHNTEAPAPATPPAPPLRPGRGARWPARPRPLLPRDPTCRARTPRPLPRLDKAEGSRRRRFGLRRGWGVTLQLSGRLLHRPAPVGRCLGAPKSNRENSRWENLHRAGVQPADQGTFGDSGGPDACGHPSPPSATHSGPPRDQEWPPHPRGAAHLPRPALRAPALRKFLSKGTSLQGSQHL